MQPRRLRNGEAQTEPSKLFKLHASTVMCAHNYRERERASERMCVWARVQWALCIVVLTHSNSEMAEQRTSTRGGKSSLEIFISNFGLVFWLRSGIFAFGFHYSIFAGALSPTSMSLLFVLLCVFLPPISGNVLICLLCVTQKWRSLLPLLTAFLMCLVSTVSGRCAHMMPAGRMHAERKKKTYN